MVQNEVGKVAHPSLDIYEYVSVRGRRAERPSGVNGTKPVVFSNVSSSEVYMQGVTDSFAILNITII